MVLLKLGFTDDGRMLAIAYELKGGDIHVLDAEMVADADEGRRWFDLQPWIERQ